MSFASRIRSIRITDKKLNSQEFAQYLGIGTGTLSSYENGKTIPGGRILSLISEKLNVNSEWLLSGEGEKAKRPMSAISRSAKQDNCLNLLNTEKKETADVGCFVPTELDELRQENTRLYKRVEVLLEENGNLRVQVERLKGALCKGNATPQKNMEEDAKADTA